MRRSVLLVLMAVGIFACGCTSSDKEYVRNHIVIRTKDSPPPLALSSQAPSPAHAVR